jgi:hypothetical protein
VAVEQFPVIPLNLDHEELNRRVNLQSVRYSGFESKAVDNLSFAGYGGLRLATPRIGSDIGAGVQIIEFDATLLSEPKFISQDLPNNSLEILRPGVWAASINLGFDHNESSQSRRTNVTVLTPQGPFDFYLSTSGHVLASIFHIVTLFEVAEESVELPYQLQIGGGDVYTSVEWTLSSLAFWSVGEWRGSF